MRGGTGIAARLSMFLAAHARSDSVPMRNCLALPYGHGFSFVTFHLPRLGMRDRVMGVVTASVVMRVSTAQTSHRDPARWLPVAVTITAWLTARAASLSHGCERRSASKIGEFGWLSNPPVNVRWDDWTHPIFMRLLARPSVDACVRRGARCTCPKIGSTRTSGRYGAPYGLQPLARARFGFHERGHARVHGIGLHETMATFGAATTGAHLRRRACRCAERLSEQFTAEYGIKR